MFCQMLKLHQPEHDLFSRELFQDDGKLRRFSQQIETTFSDNEAVLYYRSKYAQPWLAPYPPNGILETDWVVWAKAGSLVWLLGYATTDNDALRLARHVNDTVFVALRGGKDE